MSSGTPRAVDVDQAEIARAVGQWLALVHPGAALVRLSRRRWEYSTSAPLELIVAVTADGTEHELVLKHLGSRHVTEPVRRVKPAFAVDSCREVEVYRRLLAPLGIGPALVGSRLEPDVDAGWLLLERLRGPQLSEVGELAAWVATAEWLGAVHVRLKTMDNPGVRQAARLIECHGGWYRIWMDRALRFCGAGESSPSRRDVKALRWLADRYDLVIDRLLELPSMLIHGELYPANVIISGSPETCRPCAIDWETASIGPGVLDLAALTSGDWAEADRRAVIAAYRSASGSPITLDELSESVRYAQIHLAVQWLGWFGRRRAPDEHARDWLADAVARAEALKL